MALACAGLGRLQKLEPALVWGEATCLLIPRADCLVTKVANLSGVQKPPVPRAPPPSYHRRRSHTLPLPSTTLPYGAQTLPEPLLSFLMGSLNPQPPWATGLPPLP